MDFLALLVVLLLLVVVSLCIRRWLLQQRIERLRVRARLHVIEGQLATLRAILRIQSAEHQARRRALALRERDPFANRTDHEQYRSS